MIQEILVHYAGRLLGEAVQYFLFAGGVFLLFWVILRNKMTPRLIQGKFPTKPHLIREIQYSISTIFIFSTIGTLVLFANKNGWGSVYHDRIDRYGMWYFVLGFPMTVFLHNTYFYWTHRMMHHRLLYPYFHKVHHLSVNPSPWAAYAFHPLEAIVQGGIGVIFGLLIPLHLYHLAFFGLFTISYNVFGHLSMEIFPSGFTRSKWFFWHNTPTHHNMHHRYFNSHFSLYFNFWDRIMGTMHPDYDRHFEKAAFKLSEPPMAESMAAE